VLRLAAIAVVAGSLALAAAAATSASAADRPGTLEGRIASSISEKIHALAVTSDGRILVGGAVMAYPLHSWIRAYLSDGTPDRAFSHDGEFDFEQDSGDIVAMVALPDGRMIVAQSGPNGGPWRLLRLNRDGSIDTSFGTGGSVEGSFGSVYGSWLTDFALQPDGRIVVLGVLGGGDPPQPKLLVVRRYLPDGSPDTTFGTNGVTHLSTDDPNSRGATMAIQPSGSIVLAARNYNVRPPTIARLSADGHLDDAFGQGGLSPIELSNPRWGDVAWASVRGGWRPLILPNRRIRVPIQFYARGRPGYRMALVGLTADGHPDRGFGLRGLALAPRPRPPAGESPVSAISDESGGILVAGDLQSGEDFTGDDAGVIRRFRRDGSLDLPSASADSCAGPRPAADIR
jgi:uncharacterized delta-60 repeat protein